MPTAAPMPRKRCAPTATTCSRSSSASASWSMSRQRDLSTTILGEPARMPLILAPVGSTGMQYRRRRNSRLPRRAGRRHSLHAEHDVDLLDRGRRRQCRQAVLVPALRDEGPRLLKALIERAIAAKCSALVLTVDLQVIGQRHMDIKNGMTVPPEWCAVKNLVDFATKPRLGRRRAARQAPRPSATSPAISRARDDLTSLSQLDRVAVRHVAELEGRRVDPQHLAGQADPQGHPRRRGRRAGGQDRRAGAGGLQPWRPPARRRAVVDRGAARRSSTPSARRSRCMFDGGIRSGQDVMRALALGAKSCMIGRAYIYGLGAWRPGRRRQGDRPDRQRTQRHHGPVRRQHHRRDRRSRAGDLTFSGALDIGFIVMKAQVPAPALLVGCGARKNDPEFGELTGPGIDFDRSASAA